MTVPASPPAAEVAVSFVPHRLRAADQWRFVLRRVYPRAVDPLRSALVRWAFMTGYLALVGAFVGFVLSPALPPALMAGCGAVGAQVLPWRIRRIKRLLLRGMGPAEVYTVTVGPAGATVENATRVLLLRWVGATGVLVTAHEVVIRYRTLDVVSVPARTFDDDAHLGRFVTLARSRIADAAGGAGQGGSTPP